MVEVESAVAERDNGDATVQDESEEQEYEFRLFSAPVKEFTDEAKSITQKIVLDAEQEDVNILGETIIRGNGAFISGSKDPRVWTTPKAEGERLVQLQFAAVTGENVLRDSARRNWGLEVPWRVKIIKQKSVPSPGLSGKLSSIAIEDSQKKRKKPGKKRRVVLRMRVKRIEEEKTRKEKESNEKEEAEKERRTKKNREKKLKQKMRAKAKAQAAKENEPGVQKDEIMDGT